MIELRPAKYLLGRLAPMDNNDKIPQFNLGAGTYNSTVFLRGDGVWADPLAAGFVPTSRTLTINGVTYDLSANRTWTIDKASVGLGNVDNTSDANKPISTATQTALNLKEDKANKGIPNGYASLAGDGKVPSTQLPSYVDDVIEVANYAALPTIGETGVIYITLDNNNVYRWSGSVYVQISQPNAVWGSITGTLSNQVDLQAALNAKQNNITLTTTGTSGAATLIGATLNIPQYSQDLSGYIPYVGATGNVNLGEYGLSAGWLRIDTSPTTYVAGTGGISWNSVDGTADLELLNGVTLQIGQELHFYAKATEVIPNGSAVMFAGVQGDHLLIAKASSAVLNANPNYFMGVATQDFVNNEFGYVTAFGNVRGLNTTAYSLGSVLYFDSTSATPGLLTATMPNANLAKIEVAAVVRVHANQGILMVRPHVMPMLNEIQDVNTNLSKTTPIDTDSVLLQDTADSNIWKKLSWLNTKATLKTYFDTLYQAIGNYVPTSRTITINSTTQDLSANRSWTIDKTSVGLGNVDNTSDLNKPISTATQTALNAKQDNITLTTTGTSGAATLVGSTLNIPQYQSVITNPITGTGTLNYVAKFGSSSTIENSQIYDNGFQVGIGLTNPSAKFHVNGLSILTNPNGDNYNENIRLPQASGGYASIALGGAVASLGTSIQQWTILKDPSNNFMIRHYNTDHLFINTDGNVGLGTSNAWFPASGRKILSLNGTGSSLLEFQKGGVISGYIYSTDSLLEISGGDSAPQTFLTSNTERMRIATNGNVGIGTSNPNQKLEVNSNIRLITSNFSANAQIGILGFGPEGYAGVNSSEISSTFEGTNWWNGSNLIFKTSASPDITAYPSIERMRITAGGNVGIGISNPDTKLNVFGVIRGSEQIDASPTGGAFRFYDGSAFTGGLGVGNWAGVGALTDIVMYLNNTNYIITNQGSQLVKVLTNGNFGIGTTAPSQKLMVDGNIFASTGNGMGFLLEGGNSILRQSSTELGFNTNGSEKLRITTSGSVGIGTTAPQSKLDITDWTTYISVSSAANSESTTDGQPLAGINFRKHYGIGIGASIKQLQAGGLSNYSQAHLAFYTNDASIGWNDPVERMRITSSGAVIIGSNNSIYATSGRGVVEVNGDSTSIFGLRIAGSNAGYIYHDGTNVNIWNTFAGAMKFATYNTERMRISSDGNIGIGTTNPNYTLDVNGFIGATRIYPANSNNTYITGDGNAGMAVAGNGYFYVVASGGSYFQNEVRFRNIISNDINAYLQINGGTTGVTYFAGTIGVGSSAVYYGSSIQVGKGIFYAQDNGSDIGGKIYGFWDSGYQPYAGGLKLQVFRNETGSYAMYDAMTLSGSGNVGIGTTTPSQKLEISSTNSSILKLYNTEFNYGANQSKIDFFGKWYSGYPNNENLHASIVGEHGTGDGFRRGVLRFYTNNDGTMISPMMINYIGNVAIGTSAPHPSAILDLTSTTQGFLPPRMSDSEISSIASPRAGLIVWSIDSEVLNVFDGASWRRIAYA